MISCSSQPKRCVQSSANRLKLATVLLLPESDEVGLLNRLTALRGALQNLDPHR
jgi:hypothetical protein